MFSVDKRINKGDTSNPKDDFIYYHMYGTIYSGKDVCKKGDDITFPMEVHYLFNDAYKGYLYVILENIYYFSFSNICNRYVSIKE